MSYSLRTLVSADKRRYTADGYNLDLTYITPRLIAMGLPGKGISALWRNKVEEVASFLDKNHFGHYRIFSLGKSAGDFFRLRNNTTWFGWSSKKSPPLELLHRILLGINDWLAADPQNIAVIHCKEGRERSGVVIASYLVKSGVFATPREALEYYATMRSKNQEGVSTPSQLRYVNYITSIHQLPAPRKIFLRRITLRPVPDYSEVRPIVEILNSGVVPAQSLLTLKDFRSFRKPDFSVPLELSFAVQGDTYIQVFNKVTLLGLKTNLLLFRIGFHTSFVPHRWVLTKAELDGEMAGPVHDDRLRMGFSVELLFTDGPFDALPVDPASVAQTNSQQQFQAPTQELYPRVNAQMASTQNTSAPVQYAQAPNNYPMPSYASMSYPVAQTPTNPFQAPVVAAPPVQLDQRILESNYVAPQPSTQSYGPASVNTGSMGWYHPSVNSSMSTMPPPVNRETKDNRQMLNQATDAVARATERLMTISKPVQVDNNIAPVQKTQM